MEKQSSKIHELAGENNVNFDYLIHILPSGYMFVCL